MTPALQPNPIILSVLSERKKLVWRRIISQEKNKEGDEPGLTKTLKKGKLLVL